MGVGGWKSYSPAWHCIPAYSESLAERETFFFTHEILQQMIMSCACHFSFIALTWNIMSKLFQESRFSVLKLEDPFRSPAWRPEWCVSLSKGLESCQTLFVSTSSLSGNKFRTILRNDKSIQECEHMWDFPLGNLTASSVDIILG